MNRSVRSRLLVLVVALVALAVPAGIAYAYWTSGATGGGSGNTGTLSALSLTPGSPAASLYPGSQTNVVLTATNSNIDAVRIGSLILDTSQGAGGFAVDAGHAACSVATLSYATQNNAGAGWTVPGRVGIVNGTLPISLSNALTMGAAAASACQGATFTVYLVAG